MSQKDYAQLSIEAHQKTRGKITVESKMPLETKDDLSIAYTPGVAQPCKEIAADKQNAYKYTSKGNLVAVVSDGTAVLGLGDIGPEAALPVMEGKAVLFKKFADVDAVPIVLNTKDTEEIIQTIKNIAPGFGGINLEDISAPRCFEIEQRLKRELDIPVFHDDQHGTAIVTLAGIYNALKLSGEKIEDLSVVVNGAGAAGVAIVKLLFEAGVKDIIMCDSRGIIHRDRENLTAEKAELAEITNKDQRKGSLKDAVVNTDVFIGVSVPKVLTKEMVKSMNKNPFIFAMANPDPEILPHEAKEAGAAIIATGRSDYPNQLNNVLVFPGLFRGALDARVSVLTTKMYIKAAKAIADCVEDLSADKIIPSPFDERVPGKVAEAISGY